MSANGTLSRFREHFGDQSTKSETKNGSIPNNKQKISASFPGHVSDVPTTSLEGLASRTRTDPDSMHDFSKFKAEWQTSLHDRLKTESYVFRGFSTKKSDPGSTRATKKTIFDTKSPTQWNQNRRNSLWTDALRDDEKHGKITSEGLQNNHRNPSTKDVKKTSIFEGPFGTQSQESGKKNLSTSRHNKSKMERTETERTIKPWEKMHVPRMPSNIAVQKEEQRSRDRLDENIINGANALLTIAQQAKDDTKFYRCFKSQPQIEFTGQASTSEPPMTAKLTEPVAKSTNVLSTDWPSLFKSVQQTVAAKVELLSKSVWKPTFIANNMTPQTFDFGGDAQNDPLEGKTKLEPAAHAQKSVPLEAPQKSNPSVVLRHHAQVAQSKLQSTIIPKSTEKLRPRPSDKSHFLHILANYSWKNVVLRADVMSRPQEGTKLDKSQNTESVTKTFHSLLQIGFEAGRLNVFVFRLASLDSTSESQTEESLPVRPQDDSEVLPGNSLLPSIPLHLQKPIVLYPSCWQPDQVEIETVWKNPSLPNTSKPKARPAKYLHPEEGDSGSLVSGSSPGSLTAEVGDEEQGEDEKRREEHDKNGQLRQGDQYERNPSKGYLTKKQSEPILERSTNEMKDEIFESTMKRIMGLKCFRDLQQQWLRQVLQRGCTSTIPQRKQDLADNLDILIAKQNKFFEDLKLESTMRKGEKNAGEG